LLRPDDSKSSGIALVARAEIVVTGMRGSSVERHLARTGGTLARAAEDEAV
jgi:hypothetical protein